VIKLDDSSTSGVLHKLPYHLLNAMNICRTFFTALVKPLLFFIGINAFVIVTPTLHGKDQQPMKVLFEFTGDNPDVAWRAINDGVMGGLSEGSADIVKEGMLFNGQLSLENNGGFSTISYNVNFNLSDFLGIQLTLLGDGRTYQLRLQSDATFSQRVPVSFSSEFKTTEGEWVEVFLPFSSLSQSWRGRQLSGYIFNLRDIRRIGVLLADKKSGDFSLKIATIAVK
jgi:NADH dehydrogenase [ubiquinone] 1 alpha subcomplex assembly factor 1